MVKLQINTEKLWQDLYFDAQERINQLMRDRALYASWMRSAAHTFRDLHYDLTAQALINTVDQVEKREADNIALLEERNIMRGIA